MTIFDRDIFEHIPKREMFDIDLVQLIQVVEHDQTSPLIVLKDQHQMIHHYENIDQWSTSHIDRIHYIYININITSVSHTHLALFS